MNLKSKPQGYISAFASHGEPAYSTPPPKLIQQKQEQTLLGANLKSFIKERLFGNFINYTKFYNPKKFNFTPITSLTDPNQEDSHNLMRSSPAIREGSKHKISEIKANMQRKIQQRYKIELLKLQDNGKNNRISSQRKSIDKHLQQPSQRTKINHSRISNKYSLHGSHVEKRSSYDFQKFPASSFISAIQEHYERPKKQPSARKEARLTPLQNKVQLISKLEKVKSNLNNSNHLKRKNPNRIESQKYQVVESIWQCFCQPVKLKNQVNNESIISNVKKSIEAKTLQANKSTLTIEKSKFSQNRTHFLKESFVQYINSIRQTYPPIAIHFYNFFQISSKLYDQLKIQQYKVIVEVLATSSSRVWAVSSFRFWDCNQDGIICSKDIFTMYQTFDLFENKLKQEDNFQNTKTYKLLLKLRDILSNLSTIITQINFDNQLQKKKRMSENLTDDKFQMKYLEQALLRKRQVKYSDLVLVLGHNIKNAAKDTKKSVFETGKELSMKYSSCYRYSFIATDHNQQTRQDRQHIQTLKEQLKKQKMELVQKQSIEGLEKDKIMGIDYKTYNEKQLFGAMKGMVLDIFAVKLV